MTRAQVRNLEERSAVWVAKHLVMAGRLIEIDPELAFQHALAASRRGGRLAAVREAVGLTAYAAGHYGEALREFRTFRRISGSNVHLPVMADCERGLGRPDRALDLARSEEAESLDAAGKAELAMVVSGARSDLGQLDAAVAALEIPQLDLHRAFTFSPRLFRAYADALDAAGRTGESDKWRRQALVAEKALGIDEDLDPDIIDLGEDEDSAPFPVPKVADVLGQNVTSGVGSTGPAPVANPQAGSGSESGSGSSTEPEEDPITVDEAPGFDGVLEESVDLPEEAPGVAVEPTVPGLDADLGVANRDEVGDQHAEPEPGIPGTGDEPPAPDEDPVEAPGDAVAVGTVPVGDPTASVEPLQTEMLFSMDEAGTPGIPADTEDSSARPASSGPAQASETGEDAQAADAHPETAIEFSSVGKQQDADAGEVASAPSASDTSEATAPAPKRKRAGKAKDGEVPASGATAGGAKVSGAETDGIEAGEKDTTNE